MNHFFFPEDLKLFPEPVYGIVVKAIVQGRIWRVKCNGSYWSARLYDPDQRVAFEPGQPVGIVAIQGITLLITAIEPPES